MKKAPLLPLLFCALLLSGCWDRREIEELKFITVMGVDRVPGNKVLLSFQVINTDQLTSSQRQGSSAGGELYYLVTVRGRNLYEAFHNYFTRKHGRRGIFSHLQAVMIGEEFARHGMPEYLDWLTRDREISVGTEAFLVKGQAYELMKIKPPQERLSGSYLEGLAERTADVGLAPNVDIPQMMILFTTPGRDALLPRLEKAKLDVKGDEKKNETLQLNGAGVFRGGNLCGWLSTQQTRGYLWLKEEFRDPMAVVVPNEGRRVSVDVHGVTAEIKPRVSGNKVSISVEVSASGEILEVFGPGQKVDEAFFLKVGGLLAQEIKKEITDTIAIAQNLGSDFIGFGELVRGTVSAEQWKAMDWRRQFSRVPIKVKVAGRIRRSGVAIEHLTAR